MMSSLSYLSVFLIFFVTVTSLANEGRNINEEQKQEQGKEQFYIGLEINRMPYVGLGHDTEITGLLTTSARQLCKTIKIKCNFISDSFSNMLRDIQLDKLGALLIVDQLVLPKTDKLKLTLPLCKMQPVFIHSSDLDSNIKVENLAETTIGVKKGSRLHFYLIENYTPHVTIKPYSLLQNGLFDLLTDRIDRLATDKAFASANLAKATFAKRYTTTSLSSENNKEPDFFNKEDFLLTQMTLALGEDNTRLYEKLNQAIRARGQTPYCSDLLPSKDGG